MSRILNWWRALPRCEVDGKRIWASGPYVRCRKHEQEPTP